LKISFPTSGCPKRSFNTGRSPFRQSESASKRQLKALFENGGGPGNLNSFLNQLASKEVKKLQAKDPIRQLVTFIKKNLDAA
jgi:hypothetical protein